METAANSGVYSRAARRTARLPQRVRGAWRLSLVWADAAIVMFISLVVLTGAGNRAVAAIVTAGILSAVFWQCGLYRRSYAVYARDEIYHVCTAILLAAIPVLLVLATVAGMTLASVAITLVFCAIATSAVHMGLHIHYLGDAPANAGLASITPLAWHDRESADFRLSKRLFDTTVAAVGLIALSPVLALCAVALLVESGRPVFFRQERVGESARPFLIFKFRTMTRDAGPDWAKPGDSRITRLGGFMRRTSLDELPQLFNVLLGEMSIVGPRPEMLSFAKQFSESIAGYDQRHVVAPGITGWAQLYQKRNLQPSDIPNVARYDLFYVEHASLPLDVAILLKTIAEFLFHRAV